jgi:hypothetical protein
VLLLGLHSGDPIGEPLELSREVLMLVILAAFEPLHAGEDRGKLLDMSDEIRAFIAANEVQLKAKD